VADCTHLDQITVEKPDRAGVAGCEECLKIGATWVHLRVCRTCGKVGCCDSSPNRHATAHVQESDHPIVSSLEPGEDWTYCYVDDLAFILEGDVAG
jgi:uncharacterized UBP type Zn finger protein